jgi:hypothetical protein
MIALLRYLYLKSARDSSLIAFLFVPMLIPVAALSGVTLRGHLQYPFYMNPLYTPVQNATLAASIAMATSVLFASIAAFWTLRAEIATRSIGSFLFAARPLTIALALILFSTTIGLVGWLSAVALTGALTTAVMPHFALVTLKVVVALITASAAGALVVTISPQPGMIIGSYLGCAVLFPLLAKSTKGSVQLLVAVVVAIVCTALSAFLLERRCAT